MAGIGIGIENPNFSGIGIGIGIDKLIQQVLVLVLVLTSKGILPKHAADTQKGPINPNCKFQTIQKCLYNLSLPLYRGFKAYL